MCSFEFHNLFTFSVTIAQLKDSDKVINFTYSSPTTYLKALPSAGKTIWRDT